MRPAEKSGEAEGLLVYLHAVATGAFVEQPERVRDGFESVDDWWTVEVEDGNGETLTATWGPDSDFAETLAIVKRRRWLGEIRNWPHPTPAASPDISEALALDPVLRAVAWATDHVSAQEEGMTSVAHGIHTAVIGRPPFWRLYNEAEPPLHAGSSLLEAAEQYEAGYYLGRQLLWSMFGPFEDGAEELVRREDVDVDVWLLDESPEEWIASWRASIEAKGQA